MKRRVFVNEPVTIVASADGVEFKIEVIVSEISKQWAVLDVDAFVHADGWEPVVLSEQLPA